MKGQDQGRATTRAASKKTPARRPRQPLLAAPPLRFTLSICTQMARKESRNENSDTHYSCLLRLGTVAYLGGEGERGTDGQGLLLSGNLRRYCSELATCEWSSSSSESLQGRATIPRPGEEASGSEQLVTEDDSRNRSSGALTQSEDVYEGLEDRERERRARS